MEYRELSIRSRTNIDLNVVGAEIESGFDRRDRIFDVAVFAVVNTTGACRVILLFRMHLRRQSAMRNQDRLIVARRKQRSIVKPEQPQEGSQEKQHTSRSSLHSTPR